MKQLLAASCLALLVLLGGGCQNAISGFLSCGTEVCSAREVCVETSSGASCVCADGFVGEGCSACASGYRADGPNQCVLIPINCQSKPSVCGLHGTCVSPTSGDSCDCDEHYTGRLCELCASGYQDNDSDGTCRATCAEAKLGCKAPSRCSDAQGTAVCECPLGYTGDDCSRCALGYRSASNACVLSCAAQAPHCAQNQRCVDAPSGARCECAEGYQGPSCAACAAGYRSDPSTGSCLPTCAGAAVACGDHGACDDSVGFAHCVCDLGYRGAECDSCVDGYASTASGGCEHALTAQETFVMIASYQSRAVVASVDPSSGVVVPLSEGAFAGLAAADRAGAAFVNSAGTISRLSIADAKSVSVVANSGAVGPLAWDETSQRLYALTGKAPYQLLSIDPATKAVVKLFDTGLAGVADLAFDAVQNRVLALRDSLFAVSLVDGALTSLGGVPPATVGIDVTPDGALLALSATDADEAQSRVQACRATAQKLGIAGYAGASGRFIEPAPDVETQNLSAATSSAPELLSYLGRGAQATPRQVEVALDNPQAVVCLALEEASVVHVPPGARFRALVIYSSAYQVELGIDVAVASAPRFFLGGYAPEFVHAERDDIVDYTPAEWISLALPIDARFHRPGPGVLHRLDADLAIEQSTLLAGPAIPAGPLGSWTPVAP
jgi:hypothetical protein